MKLPGIKSLLCVAVLPGNEFHPLGHDPIDVMIAQDELPALYAIHQLNDVHVSLHWETASEPTLKQYEGIPPST